MSAEVGPGRPPAGSRWKKGQSGNPKGRRPGKARPQPSVFDIVLDRTLTVNQGGKQQELTVEEGLQLKTYQAALAGRRSAQRQILKMIVKRQAWFAKNAPKDHSIDLVMEPTDPTNANAALLLLGIAERDTRWGIADDKYERLLLQPWAVQAALRRPGGRRLSEKDISEIERCTRDPHSLKWPKRVRK